MADKIKKFFEKKKVDSKFKKLGPGHKLNASAAGASSASNIRQDSSSQKATPSRAPLSSEANQAAAAALARLDDQNKNKKHSHFNTSHAAIKAQVRRELESDRSSSTSSTNTGLNEKINKKPEIDPSFMIVSGVYFKCPIIGPDILPKNEWTAKVKEFLYDQLAEEPGLTSCLIIRTCNKNKEKVELCVETLCKYLENVMNHPEEERYRRIRLSNRIFSERVASLEGTQELLSSAGFILTTESEGDFYIYNKETAYSEDALPILLDALRNSTSIRLELDRNLQVLLPSHVVHRSELPLDFFNLKLEELKAEQQTKIDQVEKKLMLRTKAMREKDELRQMKKYKYAVIRIRFPDGLFLQGTFSVYEQFEDILNFLNENIIDDCSYNLIAPNGQVLNEENANASLLDLGLVPATILTFAVNSKEEKYNEYLKPEVMQLCQPVG